MANMEGTHVAQLHLSPHSFGSFCLCIVSGLAPSLPTPGTVAVNMTFGVLTFLLTLAASRTQTSCSYRSMAGKNSSSLLLAIFFCLLSFSAAAKS